MRSSDDLFLPGKPQPTRPMLEGERAAAITTGLRKGATVRPAASPVPLLRSSSIVDLQQKISRHLTSAGRRSIFNVFGNGGTGTSTLAVRATAAVAQGRGRVIYLDLSRVRRPEEIARKILLALEAPLDAVQSPLENLAPFARLAARNNDILLLDNCTDIQLLSGLDPDLPKCVIVSRIGLKKSPQLRSFEITPIDLRESEGLAANLLDKRSLPTQYIEDLSYWVSQWPAGIPFMKTMVQHRRIEELAAMFDLRPSPSSGIGFFSERIWELISQDALLVLSALLTADWLQVTTASISAMAGIPSPLARSALEELHTWGILVKVPRAYRLQNSIRMALQKSKLKPRQWRQDHYHLTIQYTLSRLRRIAREIVDVTALDEVSTIDQLNPAVRRSYSTFVSDVAWLEREWPSVEALVDDADTDPRSAEIGELVNFLSSSLPPLRRFDSLRRLQEHEYRSSQTYGGKQEQRDSLKNLSVALENEGNLADAIAAQNRAVNLSREGAKPRELGSDLVRLALMLTKVGEADDATSALEEAVAVFRSARVIDGEAGALLNLGELYEKAGDSEDALAAYSRAIQLLNDSSHARDRGLALLRLGAIHESRARWDSARQAYLDAVETLERVKDRSLVALSWLGLGRVDAKESHLSDSRSALVRALETYYGLSDHAGQLTVLLLLGDVTYRAGNSAEAGAYYRRALEIAHMVDDSLNAGRSYAGLSRLDSDRGNSERSLILLRQALASFTSAGSHEDRATALKLLADVYRKQANYNEAVNALSEALDIYFSTGDSRSSVEVLTGLGDLYHHMGSEEQAASYFERAASQARGADDHTGEAIALRGLMRSYTELHLPTEASNISRRIDYLEEFIGTVTAGETTGNPNDQLG